MIQLTDTLEELEARLKQWDEAKDSTFPERLELLIDYVNSKTDNGPTVSRFVKEIKLEVIGDFLSSPEHAHCKFLMELLLSVGIEIGKLQLIDHLRVSSAKVIERFPEE